MAFLFLYDGYFFLYMVPLPSPQEEISGYGQKRDEPGPGTAQVGPLKIWQPWNEAGVGSPGIETIDAEHTESQERRGKRQATSPWHIFVTCTCNESVEPEESDQVPRPEPGCANSAVEQPRECQPAYEAGQRVQATRGA